MFIHFRKESIYILRPLARRSVGEDPLPAGGTCVEGGTRTSAPEKSGSSG